MIRKSLLLLAGVSCLLSMSPAQTQTTEHPVFQPRSEHEATRMAHDLLTRMTNGEKLAYVGGDRSFFIRAIPRLGLREVYMTDATQGVHIRGSFRDVDLSKYQLDRSTAFPCPLLLAATWSRTLAFDYAQAVGEECRAGGIGILLGPGMNSYRHSQCGRNFEYFGEDPYLRSRLIESYVRGVQSTGTIATLKHFVANNTEFFRRRSNSIIDERTLHEIYLPPFKAGIDAGACAVMTSYNQLNGEWTGESRKVINDILRTDLGFRGLVMTDWWSVYDGETLAASGQDLEMPYAIALAQGNNLLARGAISMHDIERMALSILRTYFLMRMDERERSPEYLARFDAHEKTALQTAREGIVLLKNDAGILPISASAHSILLTGQYAEKSAAGGGSAEVKGYNQITMLDALKRTFGNRIRFVNDPDDAEIRDADLVLCNVGTSDSEGWDRPFALPVDQERLVKRCVNSNRNTVVIVTSGSGIRMTDWSGGAKAIVYAWYSGQNGNMALAEILAGRTNPSGKLPITIEREFTDSPGAGYLPQGEELYTDWNADAEKKHPVYNITYTEGIFTGYRWYDRNRLQPLFPFGHGLSYTTFEYHDLKISTSPRSDLPVVTVSFAVENSGKQEGAEVAQVYVKDVEGSVPRPLKELKGFEKVSLKPGETKKVSIELHSADFSFWSTTKHAWEAKPGLFRILVGASSADIRLTGEIKITDFKAH
jgi:beta-glucosidase